MNIKHTLGPWRYRPGEHDTEMTTIIHRSAMPSRFPPNVAMMIDGQPVTWAQVLEHRREVQDLILRRKREPTWPPYIPWRLSVAYFDQRLMGGWQAFIDNRHERLWIDRDCKWLKDGLMELFRFWLPGCGTWEEWKPLFAQRYGAGTQYGRARGVAIVRWNGKNEPRKYSHFRLSENQQCPAK
jgi:hypothetical protein